MNCQRIKSDEIIGNGSIGKKKKKKKETPTLGQGRRIQPLVSLPPIRQLLDMGKQKAKEKDTDDDHAPLFPSSRILLGVMNCLALLFLYLLRINLSLSMVCMVRKPPSLPTYNSSLLLNDSSSYDLSETNGRIYHDYDDDTHLLIHSKATTPRSSSLPVKPIYVTTSKTLKAIADDSTGNAVTWPITSINNSSRNSSSNTLHKRDASPVSDALSDMSTLPDDPSQYNMSDTGLEEQTKGEFTWSRQFQGYVLSSYFYGYIVTQVLGGFLSGRYGAKHVLGTGMLIMVVMTMLTPVATRINAYLLIALRVVLGAAGGVFFPSVQSLWGPWAPPFERSFLVSLTFFGITFGNILALWLSSQFCAISLDNGWPFAFYTTGALGFVYWVAWNFCVYSTPNQHPRISKREKAYIQKCIGSKGEGKKIEKPPVPWLKILSSPAVWAILTAQTANTWFTHTSITLPFYMKDVLKFDIKENGLFLILPYILDVIVTPFVSRLADVLRQKKILSTVVVRKLYQSTSCLVCSVLLVVLSFMDYDRRYVAVAILCLIYPFQNLYRSGYAANLQDIAPKYAGEVFGITNTAGTMSGLISPAIVGALTTNGTKQEWQMVFFISSSLFVLGGVIFAIFAKGEIQPWAGAPQTQEFLVNNSNVENGKAPTEDNWGSGVKIRPAETLANGHDDPDKKPLKKADEEEDETNNTDAEKQDDIKGA